jgi:uroporphyrinogen decarboxylase
MIKVKNMRLLQALKRQPVDKTPIWIMRQAGRYLPEYRKLRQQAGSFMQLCKTPELACAVTMQPLERFPLDAAILFSDILTIPDAMGLGLHFIEGQGPIFTNPVQTAKAIQDLVIPIPEEKLTYVLDAVQLIQQELAGKMPLIGFCGSPWTLATYMVEGRANKTFPLVQKMLAEDPALLHVLLTKLADSVSLHLQAQIAAGVQAVMIFDTWGGLLDTENYQKFSLFYVQKIIAQLQAAPGSCDVPCILFTKGGGQWLDLMAATGCDALGLDWQTSIGAAREQVGHKVALQGNMDPGLLLQTPAIIRDNVARILAEYGPHSGHIFNLGHGITPDVPVENVAALVEAVHELSGAYH